MLRFSLRNKQLHVCYFWCESSPSTFCACLNSSHGPIQLCMLNLGSGNCNSWGQSVGINHAVGQLSVCMCTPPCCPCSPDSVRSEENARGHDSAQECSHVWAITMILTVLFCFCSNTVCHSSVWHSQGMSLNSCVSQKKPLKWFARKVTQIL